MGDACRLVELHSHFGHDAFLKERELLAPAFAAALDGDDHDPQTPIADTVVRAGLESDTQHGAVVPPIHLSATYAFAGLEQPRTYDYSRSGNPTRDLLGEALAELEGGAGAVSRRPAWPRSPSHWPWSSRASV